MHLDRFRSEWIHTALAGRPRVLTAVVAMLAIVVFAAGGWAAWFSYDLTAGLPNRRALSGIGDMAQSTTIFDAADKPAFTIFKEQRIEVPLEQISPNLIKAVVSVEDQRFYEHSGVDGVRVAAAVVRNVQAGRRAEGGSTITQQLARQSFLSRDKTYRRKLKEVILAAYIEKMYSKNEILELYLNKVYFGDGLYGVEAASRGYFGKPASDLTVDEAALLAGLIQSPSSYAPTVNLDARDRPAQRRAAGDGRRPARSIEPAAERAKQRRVKLSTASRSRNRPACISRNRCAGSSSNASAGSASPRAGSASTRRWTRICSGRPRRSSRRGWRTSSSGAASGTRCAASSRP